MPVSTTQLPRAVTPRSVDIRWGAHFFACSNGATPTTVRSGDGQAAGPNNSSGSFDNITTLQSAQVSNTGDDATTRAERTTYNNVSGNVVVGFGGSTVDMRHNPVIEVVSRLPATFNATTFKAYCVSLGSSGAAAPGPSFVRLRLNPFDAASPGQLQLSAQFNNAGLITSSKFGGVAVATGSWHKLKLRVDSSTGFVYGSMDDGTEAALNCSGLSSLMTAELTIGHYAEWTATATCEYIVSSVYYETRAR